MRRRFESLVITWSAFLFIGTALVEAATISANSCSYADVKSALDRAANGDTVLVPAGNCTWTTSMDFDLAITNGKSKYLTLQGAGIDRTIITDGVSKAAYPNIAYLLRWTTVNGGLTRITGFTFKGSTTGDPYGRGMFEIRGNSQQFRFDHNKVIPIGTAALFFYGNVIGVLDHNFFNVSAGAYAVYTFHSSWKGNGAYGDYSWSVPDTVGTQEALFLEDNTFLNDMSSSLHRYAVDGWQGGRVVFRRNTFTACTMGNHGTESGGRHRSQRQFEVYDNTFNWEMGRQAFASLIASRGGVGVVFNNKANITNGGALWGGISWFMTINYRRALESFSPWGQCPSAWDQSATSCLDQPGKGAGRLISGDTPSPVGWPNQVTAPTYVWNNAINGVVSNPHTDTPTVIALNRDYYNQPRPGYTPFQYPHPLTLGGSSSSSPTAPKNLQVQ